MTLQNMNKVKYCEHKILHYNSKVNEYYCYHCLMRFDVKIQKTEISIYNSTEDKK